jgi:F0F1-type ATP synthase membrane subunit b/b'
MAVSFMTLWSLWAFLLLVLFLKSAFAHQAEAVFRRDYRTIRLNLFIYVVVIWSMSHIICEMFG